MRIVLALIGVTFLVGGGAQASTVTSGLYGNVTRGPITPICVAEQPCSAPAAGAILAFSRSGQVIARTRVRADGSYRIALSPGMYAVRAVSARPLDPSNAWVRQGRFRHVDFAIDTGIR